MATAKSTTRRAPAPVTGGPPCPPPPETALETLDALAAADCRVIDASGRRGRLISYWSDCMDAPPQAGCCVQWFRHGLLRPARRETLSLVEIRSRGVIADWHAPTKEPRP